MCNGFKFCLLTEVSKCAFIRCLRSSSHSKFLCPWYVLSVSGLVARGVCICLPNIISAGDGNLESIGAARKLSKAAATLCSVVKDFLMTDFTVCTILSTSPFD